MHRTKSKFKLYYTFIFIYLVSILAVNASKTSLTSLKEKASGGDKRACLKLGNMFFFGNEVIQDYYEAFHWYYNAAVNGSPSAQFNLAICYDQGLGIEKNQLEAFKWYQKAARANIIQAKFNLAMYYKDGTEFKTDSGIVLLNQDLPRTIKLLNETASSGFAPAKRELAKLYLEGEGVDKNINKSIGLFEEAAKGNDPEAMSLLAQYLIEKESDDKEKIVFLLKEAAKHNIPRALETLGSYYECGLHVPQDKHLAFSYYKKAAELDSTAAQKKLADYYSNGNIVDLNIWEAKYWYKKAAEKNDPYSLFMLGTYADQGIAEPINKKLAARYFMRSAKFDFPKAQYNLATYYAKGEGVSKDLKMATMWYRKAALQNEPKAQRELGFIYLEGVEDINKDYVSGLNWLTLAEKYGDTKAIDFMNSINLN